jgi:hypothetical protein
MARRQLLDLKEAIQQGALSRTQGQDYKAQFLRDNELVGFLKGKLTSAKDDTTTDALGYLAGHKIGDCSPEDFSQAKQHIIQASGGIHRCDNPENYRQVKIPCSLKKVTASDARANKKIGLLQVQSYVLAYMLQRLDVCATGQDLLSEIDAFITIDNGEGAPRQVAAHLCKRKCSEPSHIALVPDVVNKKHDYCPAWFICKGKAISFCTCDEAVKCIAPGPHAETKRFRQSLELLL